MKTQCRHWEHDFYLSRDYLQNFSCISNSDCKFFVSFMLEYIEKSIHGSFHIRLHFKDRRRWKTVKIGGRGIETTKSHQKEKMNQNSISRQIYKKIEQKRRITNSRNSSNSWTKNHPTTYPNIHFFLIADFCKQRGLYRLPCAPLVETPSRSPSPGKHTNLTQWTWERDEPFKMIWNL